MGNTVQDNPEFTLGQREAERFRGMEEAFLHRPRISIRLRIVAGFLLCFFLLAGTGLINLAILYRARGSLHFLDISQDLSIQVQQARHFERLDFPDRRNLQQARDGAKQASELLIAEGANILDISGEKELIGLNYKLGHYVQVLDDALDLLGRPERDPAREKALGAEMDARSGEILTLLRTMKAREAQRADRILRISQELPFLFAGILLVIIFWITSLLANTITQSLNRIEESTRRIAGGDFSLMNPARRYRDELSDLSLAVNRMLLELQAREDQVIKADRLASIGAFTAGIARELNNVFGTIRTNTRTFLDGCRPAESCPSYSLLEGIFSETQRGRETVEGLLEFTQEDASSLGPVDLAEVVEAARRLAHNQLESAGVTFENELAGGMPLVRAAFGQLKQVFLNLFDNAVQAMPSGGKLTVRAGLLGSREAEITVADSGVGIPPEHLPHLFDPFFSTRDENKGTGLGLSISYGIVRKWGGDLRVESVVGRGTTVHMVLPLAT